LALLAITMIYQYCYYYEYELITCYVGSIVINGALVCYLHNFMVDQ